MLYNFDESGTYRKRKKTFLKHMAYTF